MYARSINEGSESRLPLALLEPSASVAGSSLGDPFFPWRPVADLPGLVEGAHENRGLGHAFLRHAERCTCLLFVVDLDCPDPAGQLEVLLSELELYRPGFSRGPHHAVLANKVCTDTRGQAVRSTSDCICAVQKVGMLESSCDMLARI